MTEFFAGLAEFHFLRPMWLWAIIPLILIGGLLTYLHKQQSGWQSVLAGHLYKHIISQGKGKQFKQPIWILTVGWLIACIALAGPTWQRLPQPVYQLKTGKVVLLDMSMSMRATDVKPNRLARAKYKAIDLVKALSEGETGLIAYSGDAFTISPLSSDGQNLTTLIPSLSPEIMPIPGSEPVLGIQAAIDILRNASYQQGEIFWITDGVENRQMQEISELLKTSPYRLSILAIGTEDGAPIQKPDGELLKDNNGAIVIPKLSAANLKALANQGDGRYAPMQADNSDIDYLIDQSQLSTEQQQNDEQGKDNFGDKWQEMGPWLLLLILPLAAYGFRRGLISIILLGFMLPLYTPSAQAGWWQDMWQNNNQQGLKSFSKDDFAEAAEKFEDPLWLGSALYKNEEYQDALTAFSQVDSVEGRYNQANTLAKLGKLQEAINKYDDVLAEQPDNADAISNKALVEKLLEQQQSEQQKSDENKQQDQKNDPSDQQEQQDGDKSEQQQGDNAEQQDQQAKGKSEQQENQQEQNNSDNQQDGQQDQQNQSEQQEQQSQQNEQDQNAQQQQSEKDKQEQQSQDAQQAEAQEKELSDEEKEQMQRMQNLLNRVPDDPAFLLKRKMQIEAQQRKRDRAPSNLQRNW